MKKLLLSLAAMAIATGVNAEKIAFVMDGSQDTYSGDAKQVLVYTGQQTTEFLPLTADFGQIKFSNTLYKIGAFRIKKGSTITITPVDGITITKITGHQQNVRKDAEKEEANCGAITGFTYNHDSNTQSIAVPITKTQTVDVKNFECRLNWIEIEYSGTPTGICPPVFESTFPLVSVDNTIAPVSATEGVEYQYKVGKDGEWAAVPAEGFRVQAPGNYYVKAVKGSAESAESGCMFVPYGTGLKLATFTFNNWADITPTTSGKVYTKDNLVADGNGGNRSISVGTVVGESDKNDTFKDGAAMVSFSKGTTNAKIYESATLGATIDLRYYTKSTTTFSVEEGNEIISAVVCGGQVENYMNISTKTPTTYTNCTVSKFPNSDDWILLTEKDESFDPATKMSIYAGQDAKDANYTGYIAHVFINSRDLSGSDDAVVECDENAPVEYYNLQGVRVNNPSNGLYIVKQGSKVTKQIFK